MGDNNVETGLRKDKADVIPGVIGKVRASCNSDNVEPIGISPKSHTWLLKSKTKGLNAQKNSK